MAGRDSAQLEWLCRAALRAFSPAFSETEITASFYPYVGLTQTIRRKGSAWVIRVSDHCRSAPREVLEAIVILLACKVLRRAAPREMRRIYQRFRRDPLVEAAVHARRLVAGRKRIGDPEGRHHSLTEIYREINQGQFNNQIEIRRIGWGSRRSWGRLGHYDPLHHTVTISPVLDDPRVPRAVVSFIVYHELLHALFDVDSPSKSSRRHHPPEFRRAEKSHPDFLRTKQFLARFCRHHGGY